MCEEILDIFTHPELQKGEVFFSNMSTQDFENLLYQSKRRGMTAYNGEGSRQTSEDWFPVFVAREELEISNLNLVDARREFRKGL